MNKRLFSRLSIFAVAFALILGFGAVNYSNANDLIAESYPGQVNLFGDDLAQNRVGTLDADRDATPRPIFESHGLNGNRISTF